METRNFSIDYDGNKYEIITKFRKQGSELLLLLHGLGCSKDSFQDIWSQADAVMKTIILKRFVFAIVITAILSCGQNEPLTDYEPKSPQEKTLKSILLDFQDGVNTLDSKKIQNLIHGKASIMTGRDRKILSKA